MTLEVNRLLDDRLLDYKLLHYNTIRLHTITLLHCLISEIRKVKSNLFWLLVLKSL